MTITAKQQRFAEEYAVDRNATAAAERAGYSDGNYGRQLMTKANVKAAVAELTREVSEQTGITVEWVVTEMRRLYLEAKETGHPAVAAKCLDMLAKHTGAYEADNGQLRPPPAQVNVTLIGSNGKGYH